MGYHEPSDIRFAGRLRTLAPKAFDAFMAYGSAATEDPDMAIPRKYTELMAVAVALTTQCVYCLDKHVGLSKQEGATEQEIAETAMITSVLQAGAGFAHGMLALKLYKAVDGEPADAAHVHAHAHA